MSVRHRKIDASNKWRMMEAGSVIMTIIIKKFVAALAENRRRCPPNHTSLHKGACVVEATKKRVRVGLMMALATYGSRTLVAAQTTFCKVFLLGHKLSIY